MTRKIFGTDGIRGTANEEPMTAEIALKVGMAAGTHFLKGKHRHKVLIGKDTRLSGYMIEPALTAGFVSVGMDVILVGPMPTPAVAMLTRSLRADLGVMISASHNLYQDNGIKLFEPTGMKLSDEVEMELEKRIRGEIPTDLAAPRDLGRVRRLDDAQGRYMEFVKHTFPRRRTLAGLKIVLDCANGAAYKMGPMILWELEAEVIAIGVDPDGFNINMDCGSTNANRICAKVLEEGADIGISLDGDADRLIVCDEKGQIIDGDQLLAIIARHQNDLGKVQGGGIVATSMSNMGLEEYLGSINLKLERVQVGDRYVSAYMREKGYNIGGEKSGHIILRDYTTTGDGMIAALQALAALVEDGRPASEVFKVFEPYPQVLKNAIFKKKDPLQNKDVQKAIASSEERLGKAGRVVIRKSGTEPLIRVMAEGKDPQLVRQVVNDIVKTIENVANA